MATVFWPKAEIRPGSGLESARNSPFILTGDEDYPEPINLYIHERVRGKLAARHDGKSRLRLYPLGYGGARVLAYALQDLLNWGESRAAHPALGVLSWDQIRAWHITDLYQQALIDGYWSQAFWATGTPRPLSHGVIKSRVSYALACYTWMSTQGFIKDFDYEPTSQIILKAKDDTMLSYRREMRQILTNAVPVAAPRVRRAPGDLPLVSAEHLALFFAAIPNVPHRLAAMQMYETGMRAEEVVENSLIPGAMHSRERGEGRPWHTLPGWPKTPYKLAYKLDDDRMIGVIPTREAAYDEGARTGYQCDYRILGKGFKIRKVHLPPKLLRRIWTYIDSGEREALMEVRRRRGGGETAHVYLNRFGDRLEYHALWEALDMANKALSQKISIPLDITPHVLRHSYACHLLENAIIRQAKANFGLDSFNIPLELIRSIGETTLLVVQNELGHAEFKTTRKYLEQIVSGKIRLDILAGWDEYLDGIGETF